MIDKNKLNTVLDKLVNGDTKKEIEMAEQKSKPVVDETPQATPLEGEHTGNVQKIVVGRQLSTHEDTTQDEE